MAIYKNADEHGLPRHHFMHMFLATSPLAALSTSAHREFMPVFEDWIKHKLNPIDNPKRLVKLEAGILPRLGMGTLKALPAAAVTGLLSGMFLDKYLHHKLRE